ncbi:hypothetical protein R6Z07F_005738 [Ovis aries]
MAKVTDQSWEPKTTSTKRWKKRKTLSQPGSRGKVVKIYKKSSEKCFSSPWSCSQSFITDKQECPSGKVFVKIKKEGKYRCLSTSIHDVKIQTWYLWTGPLLQ